MLTRYWFFIICQFWSICTVQAPWIWFLKLSPWIWCSIYFWWTFYLTSRFILVFHFIDVFVMWLRIFSYKKWPFWEVIFVWQVSLMKTAPLRHHFKTILCIFFLSFMQIGLDYFHILISNFEFKNIKALFVFKHFYWWDLISIRTFQSIPIIFSTYTTAVTFVLNKFKISIFKWLLIIFFYLGWRCFLWFVILIIIIKSQWIYFF